MGLLACVAVIVPGCVRILSCMSMSVRALYARNVGHPF